MKKLLLIILLHLTCITFSQHTVLVDGYNILTKNNKTNQYEDEGYVEEKIYLKIDFENSYLKLYFNDMSITYYLIKINRVEENFVIYDALNDNHVECNVAFSLTEEGDAVYVSITYPWVGMLFSIK